MIRIVYDRSEILAAAEVVAKAGYYSVEKAIALAYELIDRISKNIVKHTDDDAPIYVAQGGFYIVLGDMHEEGGDKVYSLEVLVKHNLPNCNSQMEEIRYEQQWIRVP